VCLVSITPGSKALGTGINIIGSPNTKATKAVAAGSGYTRICWNAVPQMSELTNNYKPKSPIDSACLTFECEDCVLSLYNQWVRDWKARHDGAKIGNCDNRNRIWESEQLSCDSPNE